MSASACCSLAELTWVLPPTNNRHLKTNISMQALYNFQQTFLFSKTGRRSPMLRYILDTNLAYFAALRPIMRELNISLFIAKHDEDIEPTESLLVCRVASHANSSITLLVTGPSSSSSPNHETCLPMHRQMLSGKRP